MKVNMVVAGIRYTFVDPKLLQRAIDGLRASHARYLKKAHDADMAAERLQAALDKGLAEDAAKAEAKKAAQQKDQ